MPDNRVFGAEAALVPETYKRWAWTILYPRMPELVDLAARHARDWIKSHRHVAKLPEQIAGHELNENAKALAVDAFLAIYYHHHPLKPDTDPEAHIISVVNSLAANNLRRKESWLRSRSGVDQQKLIDRHAEISGYSNSQSEQLPEASGKRGAMDRTKQMQLAGALKATLPADRVLEAKLIDKIAVEGMRSRRALAKALGVSVEEVRAALNWLTQHVKEINPVLAKTIDELAKAAVPAHAIMGKTAPKGRSGSS